MNAIAQQQPLARIIECTEDEYFADPCEVPSLSQSIANILLSKSALHAWTAHPKLGKASNADATDGDEEIDTAALADGKIIHKLLLGSGAQIEVIDGFDDFRKKAAQEARDFARSIGRVPILRHKYDALAETADALRTGLEAEHGIRLDGQSEVAFEWDEIGEHAQPVRCRCRMDHVKIDQGVILDVKKIRSAHPDMCRKHMETYGYDTQWAAYTRALAAFRPDLRGRIDMRFLFLELDPPYAITPITPSGQFREIGEMRWDRAVNLWGRCLATSRWPSYTDRLISLEPSPWYVQQEMGNGY